MIHVAKPLLGEDEAQAVREVILSGMLAQGKTVASFEENFAEFCGTKHAVAVGNGTQALHAALLACGVQDGDEVITSPFSFIASATSIIHCGARPVFGDIDPETFNIDVNTIDDIITPKTKAIMPVHLFGLPADMKALRELCDDKGFALVQDACQSHGAGIDNSPIGKFGDVAAFSFYPTKNMTTGEGGAVITDDDNLRYEYARVGYNYRMTEMAAAIGIQQLKKLPAWTEKRIANARFLTEVMTAKDNIVKPHVPEGYRHVYHQYTVRVQNRDEVVKKMADGGVGAGVYYPTGLHQLGPLAGYCDRSLPHTEKAAKEVLSLPVHPALTDEELVKVADTLMRVVD